MKSWLLFVSGLLICALSASSGQNSNSRTISQNCPSYCSCVGRTIRCTGLKLSRIPAHLSPQTHLLDLRNNLIKSIDAESLQSLRQLKTLVMNDNELVEIQDNSFKSQINLTFLYLYRNKLDTIKKNTFTGLIKLKQLYLHFNQISSIEAESLNELKNLEILFLNNNQITELLPEIGLSFTIKLKVLQLENNQLDCKCSTHSLLFYSRQRATFQLNGKCTTPVNLSGRQLSSLSPTDLGCSKPSFIRQPENLTLGSSQHELMCNVVGEPEPEIMWLKDGKPVEENSSESGLKVVQRGRQLRFEVRSKKLAGNYQCIVANFVGEVTSNIATVRVPSDSTIVPKTGPSKPHLKIHVQATVGAEISFVCSSTLTSEPHSWTLNNQPIELDDFRRSVSRKGSLVIQTVLTSDAGHYECATSSYQLNVQSPPVFKRSPETLIRVIAGQPIELMCEAEGSSPLTLVWTKLDKKPQNVSVGEKFIIKKSRVEDEGRYECQASNAVGFAVKQFTIQVLGGKWADTGSWPLESALSPNRRSNPLFEQFDIIGEDDIRHAATEAKLAVDEAVSRTLGSLRARGTGQGPGRLMKVARYPFDADSNEAAKAAEVFFRALQMIKRRAEDSAYLNATSQSPFESPLSSNQLNLLATLSGCEAGLRTLNVRNNLNRIKLKHLDCESNEYHQKYRTFDGTCNNRKYPYLGSALTSFRRVLEAQYDDGIYRPRGSDRDRKYNGFKLPSARTVSLVLTTNTVSPDQLYSHMFMQFGQFIDHDLDHTMASVSFNTFAREPVDCSRQCSEHIEPCFSIKLDASDPRTKRRHLAGRSINRPGQTCIELIRSAAFCGTGLSSVISGQLRAREQVNQVTSYLDGSMIYGSTEQQALELRRSAEYGQLRITRHFDKSSGVNVSYLPLNEERRWPVDCQQEPGLSDHTCYLAGDRRANEQLGLLSMHVLFVREHNRIAAQLRQINPTWTSELVFQETRKIVIAQLQLITFEHWLPKVLGPHGMDMVGRYDGYNASAEASIGNVFATAALRFGHTLINPFLMRLNESNMPHEQFKSQLPLHEAFFAPHILASDGGIDPLIRGLVGTSGKGLRPDEIINRELTEHLFELSRDISLDLAAINIQRGRDHGLPGYNEWRRHCGLGFASTFNDLSTEIPDVKMRSKLASLYGHPSNLDIWVAGIAEKPLPGSRVGATFACLLAEQFKRTRNGDRFWYKANGHFTTEQTAELDKVSLASIICHNGDNIRTLPLDVFKFEPGKTKWIPCENIPSIDLMRWKQ